MFPISLSFPPGWVANNFNLITAGLPPEHAGAAHVQSPVPRWALSLRPTPPDCVVESEHYERKPMHGTTGHVIIRAERFPKQKQLSLECVLLKLRIRGKSPCLNYLRCQ
jgi:hypothetical protein